MHADIVVWAVAVDPVNSHEVLADVKEAGTQTHAVRGGTAGGVAYHQLTIDVGLTVVVEIESARGR